MKMMKNTLMGLLSIAAVIAMTACSSDSSSGGGNSAPIANAGVDQQAYEGDVITLNAGGSTDADNDTLTYSWSIVSEPLGNSAVLSDNTAANPTFAPDLNGTYAIQLVVNDGTVDSNVDEMVLTVYSAAFTTTWKTDNVGASLDNEIFISTNGATSGTYTVDWGDGNISSSVVGDQNHTYGTAGTYTVKITGGFPNIYFGGVGYDGAKLLSVDNWGNIQWKTMYRAFYYCANVVINAADAPDLSNMTDMRDMFRNATSFNQPIGHWDVSNIGNMGSVFSSAISFNQDIGDWNTSSAYTMNNMFINAVAFNQNIGNWNTSKVLETFYMFAGATSFNQDIGDWNTSKVTNMNSMFRNATSFDQNISSWDVSKVTNMSFMFENVALSTSNYDNLLVGWDAQTLQSSVTFNGGNSQYTAGGAAEAARTNMISSDGWTITDGGVAP